MSGYHYIRSETNLWTVGRGDGEDWDAESDHETPEKAAERVHYLNGGSPPTTIPLSHPKAEPVGWDKGMVGWTNDLIFRVHKHEVFEEIVVSPHDSEDFPIPLYATPQAQPEQGEGEPDGWIDRSDWNHAQKRKAEGKGADIVVTTDKRYPDDLAIYLATPSGEMERLKAKAE